MYPDASQIKGLEHRQPLGQLGRQHPRQLIACQTQLLQPAVGCSGLVDGLKDRTEAPCSIQPADASDRLRICSQQGACVTQPMQPTMQHVAGWLQQQNLALQCSQAELHAPCRLREDRSMPVTVPASSHVTLDHLQGAWTVE